MDNERCQPLNLYLVTDPHIDGDYDVWCGFVIAAGCEDDARVDPEHGDNTTLPSDYIVQLIGVAREDIAPGTVLVTDFNAG